MHNNDNGTSKTAALLMLPAAIALGLVVGAIYSALYNLGG